MFRPRFVFVLVLVASIAGAALIIGGRTARAEQTVTADRESLGSQQFACRYKFNGLGLLSATFVLDGTPLFVPDLTVEYDRNADSQGDLTRTVAPQAGSTDGKVRYEAPGGLGFIVGASAMLPDNWVGALKLTETTCDDPGPPPADACAFWPGRNVIKPGVQMGDPFTGLLRSLVEIPVSGIGPGVYDVTLQSSDAHSEHGGQGQQHEQWRVVVPMEPTNAETLYIDDLPDAQDRLNQNVGQITLGDPPTSIFLVHERWSAPEEEDRFETPESVVAACIALDRVGDAPAVAGEP